MPRPIPPGWLRAFLRFAIWLVPAWTLATFVCGHLVFPADAAVTLGTGWTRAAVLGVWAGILGAFVETWVLPRFARRAPFGVTLLLRTMAYAVVVTLSFMGVIGFIARRELGLRPRDVLADEAFAAFLTSAEFTWFFILLLGASFLITLAFQVNRVLGPGTMKALLVGRYIRPVREERVCLFGDLKRDIVHSGDTLNTTARMEGMCGPLERRLLVSDTLLELCVLPTGFRSEEVGAVPLRGKNAPVRLFSVERNAPARPRDLAPDQRG